MSRLAMVADVHVANAKLLGGPVTAGLNRRCREIVTALRRAVVTAEREGCTGFAVLGDLFDGTRPEPQVIAAVQQALETRMEVLCLLGNHDMVSTLAGDHAMAPLAPVVSIAERPIVMSVGGVRVTAVPYEPGPAVEWLPKRLQELDATHELKGTLLLLHLGISDNETAKWLKDAQDSAPVGLVQTLMQQYRMVHAFAGNWHDPRDWKAVTQIGTICPTDWRNPGLNYGRMAMWDGQHAGYALIPGPRFVKLSRQAAGTFVAPVECQTYVRLEVPDSTAQYPDAEQLRGKGLFVECVSDDASIVAATQRAAEAAQGVESIDRALVEYVGEMSVAEELRPVVLETAKSYLNG